MSPELALLEGGATERKRLRAVPEPPLRVADIALFYGERSGGIRTYLDAKSEHAVRTGEIEHHVLVPGARERHEHGRHELPSLRVVAANGYRIPPGSGALKETLRALRPDVVLLHDPLWWPVDVIACAREIGARTVAVHHGTSNLEAAALLRLDVHPADLDHPRHVGAVEKVLRRARDRSAVTYDELASS